MAKEKLIIIEDEKELLDLVSFYLAQEGFDTLGFTSTRNVEHLLHEDRVDLMIVDRFLDNEEGSDFVARLRSRGIHVPVLLMSAKAASTEILEGFEKGADDYITKPIRLDELDARVKVLLRKGKERKQTQLLTYKDIRILMAKKEVWVGDMQVRLSRLEYDLLVEFIRNKDKVLSVPHLIRKVWQAEEEGFNPTTIRVCLNRLKKKIDPTGEKGYIKAIKKSGYILN